MKIYLAGNFPQMASIKKEYKVMRWALGINSKYRRLISFYFQDKGTENVLKAYEKLKKGVKFGEND
jgi:hypothetical protein